MDFWAVRWRAPGRLPWKTLATFPPRVSSPTSATERYSAGIKSQKVKTNRDTGRLATTGSASLIKADSLSKETGPPLIVYRNAGYTGVEKREGPKDLDTDLQVARKRSKLKTIP